MRFADPIVETHKLGGRNVYVVREDLSSPWPGPNFSKVRGVYSYLARLRAAGVCRVASVDTSISRCGWGVSYVCQELGMTHYNVCAERRQIKFYQRMSRALGGKLVRVHGSSSTRMYYQARRELAGVRGLLWLPNGLSLLDTLVEHRQVIARMDKGLLSGTVVVCVSSGTICAGIAYGMGCAGATGTLVGVMSSSFKGRFDKVTGLVRAAARSEGRDAGAVLLRMLDAHFEYSKAARISSGTVPFPCDVYLDRKAWLWLGVHAHELREPITFWNIGGEWDPMNGLARGLRGDGIVTAEQIEDFLTEAEGDGDGTE